MKRRVPTGLLVLLALTIAAALWLLLEGPREETVDDRLLLALPPAEIAQVRVETAAGLVVLRQADEEWTLEGTVTDFARQDEALALIELVAGAVAVPVLEPADTGYGLEEPLLLLAVTATDGRRVEALVGDLNPVTGRHYATVAGRPGVLTVDSQVVRRLMSLPAPLRLNALWPRFAAADVETVRFERPPATEAELLVRDREGRWWLREPESGPLLVPPPARDRERLFADRTRSEGGHRWWLASEIAVQVLLSRLQDSIVVEYGPAPAPPETLRASGLLPPTVTVEVRAGGRPLRVSLGHALDRGRAAATRQDLPNLLRISAEPLGPALMPTGGYIEVRVLDFQFAAADSFRIERADIPPLTLHRAGREWILPGRTPSREAGELISDLVHHLDALPQLDVLTAEPGREPLEPTYRTTLTAWLPGESRPRELRLGYLPGERAAVHEPAAARLMVVRPQIMVTLRSVVTALGRPSR